MTTWNNNSHVQHRLEHETRNVIANGFSSPTTERMIALKVASDLGEQDQLLTGDDFLVEGF
tara:strand:- start:6 stop:188 length:183 start_codon:yes stop_codon:yes gene_type:complete